MISALSLLIDRTNYSRYSPLYDKEHVTIKPTGGSTGDLVALTLARQTLGQDLVIDTRTLTLGSSPNDPITVLFDLSTLQDADGFSMVRVSKVLGDYRVTASAGSVHAEQTFTITPITVEQMKDLYLQGLPLIAVERLQVKLQPQIVTGVTVIEVSPNSIPGAKTLQFTFGVSSTLSWGGGPAQTLDPAVASYVLPDTLGGSIVVQVNASGLPGVSKSESLLLDFRPMSDTAILAEILQTYDFCSSSMHGFLEPTIVITDRLLAETPGAPYDILGFPAALYREESTIKWINFHVPYPSLLRLDDLSGFFNLNRAIQLGREWQVVTEQNGLVQLVPSNAAILILQALGLGAQAFLSNRISIPAFWHYRALVGLRAIPPEILQWIGKRAAMSLLASAGLMRYPAGITNLSLARDGVSESRGLNPRGIYTALIDEYAAATGRQKDGKEKVLVRFRQKYFGMSFTTL